MGIKEVIAALRPPWQNFFVERVIGSIRRECLDHAITLHETHLHRIPPASRHGACPPRRVRARARPLRRGTEKAVLADVHAAVASMVDSRCRARPGAFDHNLITVATEMDLDEGEREMLRAAVAYHCDDAVRKLLDDVVASMPTTVEVNRTLAAMLGMTEVQAVYRLRSNGRLVTSGLIVPKPGAETLYHAIDTSRRLVRVLTQGQRGWPAIKRRLFGDPCRSSLEWTDFDHLEQDRNFGWCLTLTYWVSPGTKPTHV